MAFSHYLNIDGVEMPDGGRNHPARYRPLRRGENLCILSGFSGMA